MSMKQQLAIQAMYDAKARGEASAQAAPPLEGSSAAAAAPTRTEVARMSKARLVEELARRGLRAEGRGDDLRARLAEELFG